MSKVLFSVFRSGNKSNGGIKSLLILLKHLRVEPYLISNRELSFTNEIEELGPLYIYNKSKLLLIGKIINFFQSNFLTYRILKRQGIRVVHCNDIQAFWSSFLGGLLFGSKIVLNLRDSKGVHELGNIWKWKLAIRISDRVMVLSKSMADFLFINNVVDFGQRHKINWSYSVVDFSTYFPVNKEKRSQIRADLNIDSSTLVLLYVAAFNTKKGQLKFLEGVLPLLQFQNFKIYFIGDFSLDSSYFSSFIRSLKNLKLEDKVHIVNFTSDIAKFYQVSDINLLASEKEGLARTMIEGISCGLPMISFDVCSASEILQYNNYECGFVVPQGNYLAFAKKLDELIFDKNKRTVFSSNCYRLSRILFSEENSVDYDKLYLDLL